MTVSNAEAVQIGPSTKMAIAPCPQAPHATQNNIGKKHSRMTTANPVLSQTPLDPHRAPKNHGMAGKPKDRITKRVIRTSNTISAQLAFSIALPTTLGDPAESHAWLLVVNTRQMVQTHTKTARAFVIAAILTPGASSSALHRR